MIFATVGMQMPFDRLVRAVDEWAAQRARRDVLVQVGRGGLEPAHVDWVEELAPPDFRRAVHECDAIVTHAGVGTILAALEFGKPILVMPRRGALRETRNDHQLDTARALAATRGISVAWDESELADALDRVHRLVPPARVGAHASIGLLSSLRRFIQGEPTGGALAAGGTRWRTAPWHARREEERRAA